MAHEAKIQNLKPGDFVKAQYKYGCICGLVIKVLKNVVIVKECEPCYNDYIITEKVTNITKSRIYQVGLNDGEIIK